MADAVLSLTDNVGPLLYAFRVVFGSAMVLCLILGTVAVVQGDIVGHRARMMRGRAIGWGAGTQAFIHIPWVVLAGPPGGLGRALLMGAGWLINVAVVEWILQRRPLVPT